MTTQRVGDQVSVSEPSVLKVFKGLRFAGVTSVSLQVNRIQQNETTLSANTMWVTSSPTTPSLHSPRSIISLEYESVDECFRLVPEHVAGLVHLEWEIAERLDPPGEHVVHSRLGGWAKSQWDFKLFNPPEVKRASLGGSATTDNNKQQQTTTPTTQPRTIRYPETLALKALDVFRLTNQEVLWNEYWELTLHDSLLSS